MIVVISGSRAITDKGEIEHILRYAPFLGGSEKPIIRHGGAAGVDRIAGQRLQECGYDVDVFPADWETHGKAAGMIRNRLMLKDADALIAIWDGASRGTKGAIDTALGWGIDTYVKVIREKR